MQKSAAAKLQLATKVEASGTHAHIHSCKLKRAHPCTLCSLQTAKRAQYKCTKQTHETNARNKRTMRDTLARDAGVADDKRAALASRSPSSMRSSQKTSTQRSLPEHEVLERAPTRRPLQQDANATSICSGGNTCGVGGRSTGFVTVLAFLAPT